MKSVTSRAANLLDDVVLPIEGDIASILQLPDSQQKVLAVNSGTEFTLARINADLSLDTSFGPDGTGYLEDNFSDFGFGYAASVSLQGDKLLVVGGFFSFMDSLDYLALARYDMEGNLDTGFGDNGKIIVALPHHQGRARSLSRSAQRTPAIRMDHDPQVQADGKIVFFFLDIPPENRDGHAYLIRLTADGELDTSLDGQGIVHVTYQGSEINPRGVCVQQDQKMVVFGGTQRDGNGNTTALIGRFNDDGSLDESFAEDGFMALGSAGVRSRFTALLIDAQEHIVAIGNAGDQLLMARLSPEGIPDYAFNAGQARRIDLPVAVEELFALQQQGDALVVAGSCVVPDRNHLSGVLLRLCADGTLDSSFADGAGYHAADQRSEYLDVVIEEDGKLLVGGYAYDRGYVAWLQRFGVNG